MIDDRCMDCHDAETKKGNVDLTPLTQEHDRQINKKLWIKVERVVRRGKMPPPKKKPLDEVQISLLKKWFEKEYIKPGGIQHAGTMPTRRLTTYEVQNTLEDILHIRLRKNVTNNVYEGPSISVVERFLPVDIVGDSGFSNDSLSLSNSALNVKRYYQSYEIVLSQLDQHPSARKILFGQENLPDKITKDQAKKIIEQFCGTAFRSEVNEADYQVYLDQFQKLSQSKSAYEAMKETFATVLLSPRFLFRHETGEKGQTPVKGQELAVRLSYFLWSAPPDEELRKLAAQNKLHQVEVLTQQVRRMLRDPKRVSLSEQFAGEWFNFPKMKTRLAPPHLGETKRESLARRYRAYYEESILFFDSLIRYDRSIFNLIDANWTFDNGGEKYSLKTATDLGPINPYFRDLSTNVIQGPYDHTHHPLYMIEVTDSNQRGGFITMGSTLTITSSSTRTSPIRRGVWVLENILGIHLEVPVNVPPLERILKDKKLDVAKLTPPQILKLHTSQKSCVACHKYIDPIGLGLEAFDNSGEFRGANVEGKFPNGEVFKSPGEMKKVLLKTYREELLENVTRRFLAYALGREVAPIDRPAVQKIKESVKGNDDRINALIEAVVLSYPFRHKEKK
ncbi:MAG: DUF1592 domain-containing protein [Akkermansiaceae bacterium]|nr:DUF1592 domain-containing protein [Akkermansiaceae bacterium]